MTTQSPTLASQATAELPLQGLSSWLHHMARRFPEDGPTLLAWAKEVTAFAAVPLSCRDSHEASLKYVAGYEAGRASRAQSEWTPIDSAPKDMAARLYLVDGRCVQGFVDATGMLCVQPDNMSWRKMKGKPTHWMPLPATPGETK